MIFLIRIVVIVSLALACPLAANATDKAVTIQKNDAANSAHPGEIILGIRDENVMIKEMVGSANLELSVDMTADSVVRIASLTKQFTAVAVLALMEDRQLSLDDPVSLYITNVPSHWGTITIKQLLSHTSGLTADMTPVFLRFKDEFSPEELVGLFETAPLTAAPGSKWQYSNLNYWILGLIIGSVSGKPYVDYVNERLLQPAGLIRTRYGDQRDVILGRSTGYEINASGVIENARIFSTSIGYAAGGFVSSPKEIARWYKSLSGGEIISKETIELALTPVDTSDGEATNYGLGWYITEINGKLVAHHGGSTIGFTSYFYWTPTPFTFAGVFRNWSDESGEPTKTALDVYTRTICMD